MVFVPTPWLNDDLGTYERLCITGGFELFIVAQPMEGTWVFMTCMQSEAFVG